MRFGGLDLRVLEAIRFLYIHLNKWFFELERV